jgi:hypothetical protein
MVCTQWMLRVDSAACWSLCGDTGQRDQVQDGSGEGVILGADELSATLAVDIGMRPIVQCGSAAAFSFGVICTVIETWMGVLLWLLQQGLLSCNLLSSPAAGFQVCTQTTFLTQVVQDIQVPYSRV